MSIRYKLLSMILLAVLLPMLISLGVSKFYSSRTNTLASKTTTRLAEADMHHIIEGAINLVAFNIVSATAEELSSQAAQLKQMLTRFTLSSSQASLSLLNEIPTDKF